MSSTVNPGMTSDELVEKVAELVSRVEAVTAEGGIVDRLAERVDSIDGGGEGGGSMAAISAKVNGITSAHNALVDEVRGDRKKNEGYLESIRNTGCTVKPEVVKFTNSTAAVKLKKNAGKVTTVAWKDYKHPPNKGWRACGVYYVTTGSRHVCLTKFQVAESGDRTFFNVRVGLALRDEAHSDVTLAKGKVKCRVRYIQVQSISGKQIAEVDYGEMGDEVVVEDDDVS